MPVVVRIPAKYMAEDASESDKKVYEWFKGVSKQINGGLDVIVLPSDRDENGNRLFELEVIKGE